MGAFSRHYCGEGRAGGWEGVQFKEVVFMILSGHVCVKWLHISVVALGSLQDVRIVRQGMLDDGNCVASWDMGRKLL